MNPKVDFYFNKAGKWQEGIGKLRTIILDCGLTEELKWGCPAYSLDGKNVVLIHVFKDYCAVLFFKGALLKDPDHLLVQQTENVQSARQMRFTDVSSIDRMEQVLRACVLEAIEVEKSGMKVELKKTREYPIPEEFKDKLDQVPSLGKAFYALTPGRQRAYLLYFSSAKQAATRQARIEKYLPHILSGKGLDDE